MVQLTKDLTRTYELGDINEYPILGGELIYQGATIGFRSCQWLCSLFTSW